MAKIKIVTDSSSDLSAEVKEKYGIEAVPLKILFGDEMYLDGVDLTPTEFYEKMVNSNVLPATSQPSPGDFVEVYKRLGEEADSIISIHISSKQSGTYQSAMLAKEMLPDLDIEVIDSKATCLTMGLMVLAAAEAVQQGKSKQEIVEMVKRLADQDNTRVIFVVESLEYLQKNGRIGKASAFLGTMLNIKPILTYEDGVVAPAEKVRGKGKALDRQIAMIEEYGGNPKNLKIALSHGARPEEFEKVKQKIKETYGVDEIIEGEIGPVTGSHAGPGLIAVAFYNKDLLNS